MQLNLPNTITAGRVVLAPLAAILLLEPSMGERLLAFVVFVLAALSDLWDGHLARSRGQITNFGKIVDPVADKLLLVGTLLPLYWIGHERPDLLTVPIYGGIPFWVLLLLLGRELVITTLRFVAAQRGSVVPATQIGKKKALAQNIFIGGAILLLALRTGGAAAGWAGPFWSFWQGMHGWFVTLTLTIAVTLTAVSLVTYLNAFGRIFARQRA